MNAGELLSLCKRRGFIWPSFEIYGGVAGMYDYGPLGTNLKDNIISLWRKAYRQGEGFVEIDSETVNPEPVFKASGHIDEFSDFVVYCLGCKEPFRADHLVGDLHPNPDTLSADELKSLFVENGVQCPDCEGDLGDVEEFNLMFKTNIGPGSSRAGYLRPETAQGIFVNFPHLYRYNREKLPLGVIQHGRGYRNEISPRQGMIRLREFNMMEVELFVDPDDKTWPRYDRVKGRDLRLIPEDGSERTLTLEEAVAQGIIANEVLAYFIWVTKRLLEDLGVDCSKLRFRQHLKDEMAHYAMDCWDAEVLLSYGWTEVVGIADRGCWDLSQHSKWSKQEMTHFKRFDEPREVERTVLKAKYRQLGPLFKGDAKEIASMIEACGPQDIKDGEILLEFKGEVIPISSDLFEVVDVREKVSGEKVVPHVIEPSHGLDRIFYTILEHAYRREDDYTVLSLKPQVAPIKVGVFPLMSRDGLDAKALQVYDLLSEEGIEAYYDDSGSIGKRYARMDEVGTPWCVTVDYETLEDERGLQDTVTVRDRDSSEQRRIPIPELVNVVKELLKGRDFASL